MAGTWVKVYFPSLPLPPPPILFILLFRPVQFSVARAPFLEALLRFESDLGLVSILANICLFLRSSVLQDYPVL